MKKILWIVVALVLLGGGFFAFNNYIYQEKQASEGDYKNITYTIDGKPVTLTDGVSEEDVAGSASKIITKYFGNEVRTDLDGDGTEDVAFLLTQETGGSGTFFYVVGALYTADGWKGSHGVLLGDRIAPQTTEESPNPSHKNVIVVNYADRLPSDSMTDTPSVGKSIWLKLDPGSMQFGEVAQNFEGEANPDVMTLDMKTWTWLQTAYNNDTELTPSKADAFTITFNTDNTFSATTDCNTMSGTYAIENNQLTFGKNIAMTRMFCEGSQELAFSEMLGEVQSFFFTSKGELVLELKLDTGTAIFR